jgi:glycosyltransferase involved in cell wall biosynthesis
MRIIFSNYDDLKNPYYGGGGAVAVHEVAKRLVAKQHAVTVLTGRYPGSQDEVVDGVQYKRIGFHLLDARIGQLVFQFSLPWYAARLQYDVWVESFTPPFSTALLPLFTKKPVVGLTHLLGGKAMKLKYGLPFDIPERLGMRLYHWVIVLQQALKDELYAMSPNTKTYIIPNGVGAEVLGQKPLAKLGYIAFLGRIDYEQKGLDLLLQAYAQVKNQIGLPLKIAGTGLEGDVQRLKKEIVSLGLSAQVELVGKLSGQAKLDFLNQADFFVMSSRIENFALVLLEAFGVGLPAVVFSINGVGWVPDTAALKVEPFDTHAYAQALVRMAHNLEQRQSMGDAARNCATQYSWDNISAEYERVLRHIVEPSE